MIERELTMFTMSVTPFHPDGSVDKEALTVHLRRLIDGNNGIYVLSGGTGEGHVLSPKDAALL